METTLVGGEVGLGALFETDVVDQMYQMASSAYLRIPFSLTNTAAVETLTLRMQYDDAFVAHINGVEVARRNAPEVVSYDSVASEDRSVFQASQVEDIPIAITAGMLNAGTNLLAIQGLNVSVDADEFLLRAELAEISVETGDRLYFPTPTPRDFNPASGVEEFLLSDVTLSHEHGFYEEAFQLIIESATEGTTVRYTTDGSEPTLSNGMDYTQPVGNRWNHYHSSALVQRGRRAFVRRDGDLSVCRRRSTTVSQRPGSGRDGPPQGTSMAKSWTMAWTHRSSTAPPGDLNWKPPYSRYLPCRS